MVFDSIRLRWRSSDEAPAILLSCQPLVTAAELSLGVIVTSFTENLVLLSIIVIERECVRPKKAISATVIDQNRNICLHCDMSCAALKQTETTAN